MLGKMDPRTKDLVPVYSDSASLNHDLAAPDTKLEIPDPQKDLKIRSPRTIGEIIRII